MALNGVIDAEVNGGVKKYQSAFFSDAYMKENSEDKPKVEALKAALRDSIVILEAGLDTHRSLCPENLQALQEKLDSFFKRMKENIEKL